MKQNLMLIAMWPMFLLSGQVVLGDELYFSLVEPSYSWDTTNNWKKTSDQQQIFRLPNSGDPITINSSLLSTENNGALTIGAGIGAVCADMRLNQLAIPNTMHLHLAGGSLTIGGASRVPSSILRVGHFGPALLTLEGGALTTYDGYVGDQAGGSGIVSNNQGAINVDSNFILGIVNGTHGKLIQNGGSLSVGGQLIVGSAGEGVMVVSNGTSYAYRCIVGCSSNGVGDASLLANATVEVGDVCFVGGRYLPGISSDNDIGSGRLLLKGGTLKFYGDDNKDVDLHVRYGEKNAGALRGWGVVMGPDADNNTVRMGNNGVVVADGEGMDRDLDLHRVVSVTNSVPNGLSGTNGWYAVNRGRVLFPRAWISAANTVRNLGEYPTEGAGALDLVNSVRVALNGAAMNTFLRGGVCAADRTDLPAGLPTQDETIGVWCLGLFTYLNDSAQASFTDVSLLFRYDHTRVRNIDKLKLYRHENGAWRRVACQAPDGTGRISTGGSLDRLTSGDYNIGWFALKVVKPTGTAILIK